MEAMSASPVYHDPALHWRSEVCRAIQAFDDVLGRPPFENPPPPGVMEKAEAVLALLQAIAQEGKRRALDTVTEVCTTLPILCAALREGSPGRRPYLPLYRTILQATGIVSCFSTYPVSSLLKDAMELLWPPANSPCAGGVSMSNEEKLEHEKNEAALFEFMASSQTITAYAVQQFLRLPAATVGSSKATSSSQQGCKKGPKKKGVAVTAPDGDTSNPQLRLAFANEANSLTGTVSRALLHRMVVATLEPDCQEVLQGFFDNTPKFLEVVGDDSQLACRILDVYGGRIVPKLKPSSLLPCLDAALLDYFIDVVQQSQIAEGRLTLLTEAEFWEVPLKSWTAPRFTRLCEAAATRRISTVDVDGSLLVYVYLYVVYQKWQDATSASSSPLEDDMRSQWRQNEMLLLQAALTAVKIHLSDPEKSNREDAKRPPLVQLTNSTLLVTVSALPAWLLPLSVFATSFLSSDFFTALLSTAEPLTTSSVDVVFPWKTPDPRDVVVGVLTVITGVLEAVTSSPPSAPPTTTGTAKKHGQKNDGPAKLKKGKSGGAAGKATSVPEGKSDSREKSVEGKQPPMVPLTTLLSASCRILQLFCPASVGTDGQFTAALAASFQAVVLAHSFVLKHSVHRMNAALWAPFVEYFVTVFWCCGPEQGNACWQAAAVPAGDLAAVLSAVTRDGGSARWLSPLVLDRAKSTGAVMKWAPLDEEVFDAVVQVSVSRHVSEVPLLHLPAAAGGRVERYQHLLFPAASDTVFGAFCLSHCDAREEIFARSGDASVTPKLLVSCLNRIRDAIEGEAAEADLYFFCKEAPLVHHPIRVADVVQVLDRLCTQVTAQMNRNAELQQAEAEQRKLILMRQRQEEYEKTQQVAAAHEAFVQETAMARQQKAEAKQLVQEEAERRRAARAARQQAERALKEQQRRAGLAVYLEKQKRSRADQEAARRQSFLRQKQRMHTHFQISTYLEHLKLSSSRLMKVRTALLPLMDQLTPDDLLEYLVTGIPKVPVDMLTDSGEENGAEKAEVGVQSNETRGDFWEDIMSSLQATATPSDGDAKALYHAVVSGSTASGSQTMCFQRSFHSRVRPFLDLFCFDGGDEYDKVPSPLPSLHLRIASRLLPLADVVALGFCDVRDAFLALQCCGLVKIRGGSVAQLTLLGYRYHYPFHDPEGMLEVRVCEARDRVRAAVENQKKTLDSSVASDYEEDNEEGEEEEDYDFSTDDDQLLPEIEFGI